jgi:hypothetical protein
VRAIYAVLAVAVGLIAAPYSMPILEPPALVAYMQWLGAQPQAQETNQNDATLPQGQADMLGWPELEARVAEVWRSLPSGERAQAAIVTTNYGEAGAINFFGADDGLPRARSGHNQYGLWGSGEQDSSIVIRRARRLDVGPGPRSQAADRPPARGRELGRRGRLRSARTCGGLLVVHRVCPQPDHGSGSC